MWDHWRNEIFSSSETLNDENKLLKIIIERQRKEMMVLAKQIAILTKKEAQQGSAERGQGPDRPDMVRIEPSPLTLKPKGPQPIKY